MAREDEVGLAWMLDRESDTSNNLRCFESSRLDPAASEVDDHSRITIAIDAGLEGEWANWSNDAVLGVTK